ncbi:MAG: hypothetical protein KIT52_17860 [Anaerolineae bacterium]|nr:hypothetical protein [Anaerolineae bacterium]
MNIWLKRTTTGLVALLALALAACNGAAGQDEPAATAAAAPTAAPTTVTPAGPTTAAPTPALTIATPEAPPVASDTLAGPVIGLNLENTYEEYYLALFDVGTNTFRELSATIGLVMPYAARWFDGGCLIYADGRLLDLQGNFIWSAPDEVLAQTVDWHNSFLSPDRAWVATVVDDAGARHVEVIRLSAPFDRVRLTEGGGGHPGAVLWATAEDGLWLLFSDYDSGGVLQVFRAHPDGAGREQLTAHEASPALIVALALSPDGRRLAYGARNLAVPSQPYTYRAEDEGWVGIVDLATGGARRVALSRLAGVEFGQGLVWSGDGTRLLAVGDSLPLAAGDPLAGRQVHWLTADGAIKRSFYQADAPSGQLGWVSPLGDIDSLMFSSSAGIYRYDDGQVRLLEGEERPPIGDVGRRPVGMLPAWLGFAGEGACQP